MNPTFGSSCSGKIAEFEMKRLTDYTGKRVSFWQYLLPSYHV